MFSGHSTIPQRDECCSVLVIVQSGFALGFVIIALPSRSCVIWILLRKRNF